MTEAEDEPASALAPAPQPAPAAPLAAPVLAAEADGSTETHGDGGAAEEAGAAPLLALSAAASVAAEITRADGTGVHGATPQLDQSKSVNELIMGHHPAVELHLPDSGPKAIKPTKIAGKFVLFDGGQINGTPWTLYSAHASAPDVYLQPTPLPIIKSLTPVRLGAATGIYVGVAENTIAKSINAMVYWDGAIKTRFTTDIALNRLKLDDTRTLTSDEQRAATGEMEKWIIGKAEPAKRMPKQPEPEPEPEKAKAKPKPAAPAKTKAAPENKSEKPQKYRDIARATLPVLRQFATDAGITVRPRDNYRDRLRLVLLKHYGIKPQEMPERLRKKPKDAVPAADGAPRGKKRAAVEVASDAEDDTSDADDDAEVKAARVKLAAAEKRKAERKANLLAKIKAQTASAEADHDQPLSQQEGAPAEGIVSHAADAHTDALFQNLSMRMGANGAGAGAGAVLNYYSEGAFKGANITMCGPQSAQMGAPQSAQPGGAHPGQQLPTGPPGMYGMPHHGYEMTPRDMDDRSRAPYGGSRNLPHGSWRGYG